MTEYQVYVQFRRLDEKNYRDEQKVEIIFKNHNKLRENFIVMETYVLASWKVVYCNHKETLGPLFV